ncbi:hypothetical protein [Paenibacillus sp. GCM10027626]|uniref:hypothetical protein n=1 Tax=Paenibacillus sp. GCM10027626 TaxID=3273411 RepID=UPI00363628D9
MLIDKMQTLSPLDTSKHTSSKFELLRPKSKLHIEFSYSPKLLADGERAKEFMAACIDRYFEPERRAAARRHLERDTTLSNLLTVSVDAPDGYRGACHRHDSVQRLFLAAEEASPGLMKGPIGTGEWAVTISVHSVVTESCTYRLRVWADEEDSE